VFYRKVNFGDGKGAQHFYASTQEELEAKIDAAFTAAYPITVETGYRITLKEG
jgi:hypothetical protein